MVLRSQVVLCFVEELFEGLNSFVAGGQFSLGYGDLFFKGGVLFNQLTHISASSRRAKPARQANEAREGIEIVTLVKRITKRGRGRR